MKKLLTAGLIVFSIACGANSLAQTNGGEGIAVSIVYDGSGSMADRVAGADNQPTPKYLIANKAIASITRQLVAFGQDKHVNIEGGLIYFEGGIIREGIPLVNLTPTSGASFTDWAHNFKNPEGGTPLGLAIQKARQQLDRSHCLHKHILVITDGASNAGISPEKVVHEIRNSTSPVPIYFVAFDVTASVFDPVKAEGATVVSASDETQLNVELNHILGQKILLESE